MIKTIARCIFIESDCRFKDVKGVRVLYFDPGRKSVATKPEDSRISDLFTKLK